jgi:hypothetical protein
MATPRPGTATRRCALPRGRGGWGSSRARGDGRAFLLPRRVSLLPSISPSPLPAGGPAHGGWRRPRGAGLHSAPRRHLPGGTCRQGGAGTSKGSPSRPACPPRQHDKPGGGNGARLATPAPNSPGPGRSRSEATLLLPHRALAASGARPGCPSSLRRGCASGSAKDSRHRSLEPFPCFPGPFLRRPPGVWPSQGMPIRVLGSGPEAREGIPPGGHGLSPWGGTGGWEAEDAGLPGAVIRYS